MFINGIVQNFEHAVVQSALVSWPDVHAGPLAHAGQTFELVDFGGVVEFLRADGGVLCGLV